MFAVGFYWLATKDRPARRHAAVAPPPTHNAVDPRSVDVDEFDEWEAFAPYPDHALHAAYEANAESVNSYPPFGRREEPAHAPQATDARHDLHDAIESLMGEPDKPAPPKPATASSSGPTIRCGSGALLTLRSIKRHSHLGLADFYPEAQDRLSLPSGVPDGIAKEFREGERCREAGCFRAAAAMFRSALDKTLRANGYKEKRGTNLEQQIDAAAADGVITAARQRRAHDEIRVLGNDVLHEEWEPIGADDVAAARQYAQRILEDFYDDRESVLKLLRAKGRMADEDRPPATE
nr:DUF4145 domain-containing protein [Burkholderia multivorans]